jgi:ribonuclease HII
MAQQRIVGVDEVGRGTLCGDVVAAAVVLPDVFPDERWREIRDSKKLTAKKRAELAEYIQRVAVAWAVGSASPKEIDELNILRATMRAMHRALHAVWRASPFDEIHVDGPHFLPYLPPGRGEVDAVPHVCVPQGDATVLAIAAASIVAKVHRDTAVLAAVAARPELAVYDLANNKGYGTPKHLAALATHGPSDIHRRSFAPVAAAAAAGARANAA